MRQPAAISPLSDQPAATRTVRPAWLVGGLASIAIGLVLLEGISWAGGTALWLAGLGAVAWAWQPVGADRSCARPASRRCLVTVAGLITVGALLRLVALDDFPSGIHVDEAATGRIALQILRGGGPHPFGFAFIGDPAPFMYAQALCMALFGPTVSATRVLAGISGALTLPALWLLGRRLFGATAGLVAVALVAVNAADLHFSRMALNVIEVPLFGVLALALCWRGILDRRPVWHLLAGMSLGFSQFAAYSGRGFVLGVAGTYGVILLTRLSRWREIVGGGLLALFGMLVVLAPQLAFVRNNPRQLWDRVEFRSVFRRWDQATEIHGTTDPTWVMIGQVKVNLLAFVNATDRGTFYSFASTPLLSPLLAALAILGLAIALWRIWDNRYSSMLLACAGVLAGASLSAGVPQFHRLLPMLPIVCLLAAVAADGLTLLVARLIARAGHQRAGLALRAVLLVGLVASVAVHDLREFFVRQPEHRPWQPQTAWARWVGAQPSDRVILLAGAPDVFAWDERVKLYGDGKSIWDAADPTVDVPERVGIGQPYIVAVNPDADDWLPLLRHLLPDAHEDTVTGPRGEHLMIILAGNSDPDARPTPGGLTGTITDDSRRGGPERRREDAALVFLEASRLGNGGPFTARWRGTLLIQMAGQYRLELYTDGRASLRLGDATLVSGSATAKPRSRAATVRLTPGSYPIEIEYGYVRGPGVLVLRWQPPGGRRTVIPPSALRDD